MPATSPVIASLRERLPLDHMMSREGAPKSTSLTLSRRASHVLSPHACMRPKKHVACHAQGVPLSNSPAASKKASTSDWVSRYGATLTIFALNSSERT